MKIRTYLICIFSALNCIICYAQSFPISICDIPIEDSKIIIDKAFNIEELQKYDEIIIRNNYFSTCFRYKANFDNIKIYNETSLYNKLYDDYFTIIRFQYSGNSATLLFINNKSNLFISTLFYKNDNGFWILSYKKVTQGILKVDDFLFRRIQESKENNKK